MITEPRYLRKANESVIGWPFGISHTHKSEAVLQLSALNSNEWQSFVKNCIKYEQI